MDQLVPRRNRPARRRALTSPDRSPHPRNPRLSTGRYPRHEPQDEPQDSERQENCARHHYKINSLSSGPGK
jgi:hypothetical protein